MTQQLKMYGILYGDKKKSAILSKISQISTESCSPEQNRTAI